MDCRKQNFIWVFIQCSTPFCFLFRLADNTTIPFLCALVQTKWMRYQIRKLRAFFTKRQILIKNTLRLKCDERTTEIQSIRSLPNSHNNFQSTLFVWMKVHLQIRRHFEWKVCVDIFAIRLRSNSSFHVKFCILKKFTVFVTVSQRTINNSNYKRNFNELFI